jgi:transposase
MGVKLEDSHFNRKFVSVVGIDVHSAFNVACHFSPEQTCGDVYEHETFSTMKDGIQMLADWCLERGAEAVFMESTGVYWKTTYKGLAAAGLKVSVVNPRHAKNMPGRKTDTSDSQWLAQLGYYGLLRASFIPPPDIQAARDLSRDCRKTAQELARSKNRTIKHLIQTGVRLDLVVSDVFGKSARSTLEATADGEPPEEAVKRVTTRLKASPDEIRRALAANLTDGERHRLRYLLDRVETREAELAETEARLAAVLEPYDDILDRLETIPGVDRLAAMSILAEIGPDMDAFGTSERLCKWAGVCPGNNESGGKRKSGRAVPGNRWLRQTLCECSQAASKAGGDFSARSRSLKARRGSRRAVLAIAHKILRTVFVLITRNEVYADRVLVYEKLISMKRLPRWAAQVKRLGRLRPPDRPPRPAGAAEVRGTA